MKASPIVSVIIPTRSRPGTVIAAVASALIQTLDQIQVIVIVDGTDSETTARLLRLSSVKVRVLELHVPVGAAEARNVGVRTASGEWIAFLDDDDEWLPQKLEMQLKAIQNAAFAMPVVCSAYWARQDGRDTLFGRRKPDEHEPLSEYMFCRRSWTYGENALATSVLMVPRALMLQVPFEAGLNKHQDWDWALRALSLPGVGLVYIEEPLSVYNMPAGVERMSSGVDWNTSLAWARDRHSFLTDRAFASFVVTECLTRAVRAGASWQELLTLVRIVFDEGKPDMMALIMMVSILLVPPKLRARLRDFMRFGGG